MITELAQILSTAHHVAGSSLDPDDLYKKSHVNHPSSVWVRESIHNYRWVHQLLAALCEEYTFRYEKIHKVESSGLLTLLSKTPKLPRVPETVQALAMPEECRTRSVVKSYQAYYATEKTHLLVWRKRKMPPFLKAYGFTEQSDLV